MCVLRSVHFGAGKIGRGLVGRLLLQGGYRVLFVDANAELIELLSKEREYLVKTVGDAPRTYTVKGFDVALAAHEDEIIPVIEECVLITTSVGSRALPAVVPTIRKGLESRVRAGNLAPLDIVACENIAGASHYLRELILEGCSPECARFVKERVGFPESQIGTIAPTSLERLPGEHPLTVFTESNEEFYIERKALLGNPADVPGIQFVDDIQAYIDRKVFVVNTGHAVGGYLGYLRGHSYIHEVMEDPLTREHVVGALDEIDRVLVAEHGFDPVEERDYSRRALRRFANPDMKDLIARLAKEPIRKLGPEDRLVRPARLAFKHGITPEHIALGIAAAMFYDPPDDPQAVELSEIVRRGGPEAVLREVSGVSESEGLWPLVLDSYKRLREEGWLCRR